MATATFQEFLKGLAGQENAAEVRARRKEWVEAVERLIDRLEGWLRELDPDGVMEVYRQVVERHEPGLGTYDAHGLWIEVGKVTVEVVPGGRNSRVVPPSGTTLLGEDLRPAQVAGRVDIKNRVQRHSLYRLVVPDGSSTREDWATVAVTDYGVKFDPVDRDGFEAMLRELMS